jgi:membrane associated rhomboid family serine protease
MQELIKAQGRKAFDAVKGELLGVGVFLAAVWGVFILDSLLPLEDWLSLAPRKLSGLVGIIGMPFLHGDLSHILANTFPLFVLLGLLAGSRANSWRIVAAIIIGSGTLIWLAAGDGQYVGASALVFGLIGFLVASGFLEQRPIPLLISIVVGVMYGWTVIMGILPLSSQVSELSHFYGLVTGVAIAYWMSIDSKGITKSPTDAPELS